MAQTNGIKRWSLRGIALAAAIAGAVFAADSLYMVAKAELGQALLHQAWENGAEEPWSGAEISPVARLTVPSLDQQLFVLDSASGKAMAWGPGHVRGTAKPGQPGLSAIGGHRDSHMAFLAELGPDSIIELETRTATTTFRVSHAQIVDSRFWRYPQPGDNIPRLALTTCWPLNAQKPGPMRLVVYAEILPARNKIRSEN